VKIEFSMKQLRRRILQPTAELMAECGTVTTFKNGQRYALKSTGAKVLAVAHCDYRDCGSDHFFAHKGRVWSSRLDDRLGVYVLLDVLPKLGIEFDVLLTDDEERGASTAQYFIPEKHDYNWMFQFDRHGTDAVCYEYVKLERYLADYFKIGMGSFSDISFLEHLGICGVNVGTAYYDEHSLGSYANLRELEAQVKRFVSFYAEYSDQHFPYVAHDWRAQVADTPRDDYRPGDDDYSIAGALEWHETPNGMLYADGFDDESFEIDYVDEGDGYPWILYMTGGAEYFKTKWEAQERAEQLFTGQL